MIFLMSFYNVLGIKDTMVELHFDLILFQILIKIDTKSIHRFKLVSKQWRDGFHLLNLLSNEILQDQGSFITSYVLLELWPRELIELYTFDDQQLTQQNLNIFEEMVIIHNGERTVYQVYDDDN
ncbi:putative F-box domain-containing protein [Helianthus anomalus]